MVAKEKSLWFFAVALLIDLSVTLVNKPPHVTTDLSVGIAIYYLFWITWASIAAIRTRTGKGAVLSIALLTCFFCLAGASVIIGVTHSDYSAPRLVWFGHYILLATFIWCVAVFISSTRTKPGRAGSVSTPEIDVEAHQSNQR
jgi:hypothetical protein